MSFEQSLNIKPISAIRKPNSYVQALLKDYDEWAFTEAQGPEFKGLWREKVFMVSEEVPVDLELGSGNGLFFAHRLQKHPERCLVGVERKFKPLIQAIRRGRNQGSTNGRMLRYDAEVPENLFADNEINDVFIQFPDPWPKRRWHKNRIIQKEFLEKLIKLQKPGGVLEFKTDHREYFDFALPIFQESPYEVMGLSYDLHNSEFVKENFITHFEQIFLNKNQPIHFVRCQVPNHKEGSNLSS